MNRLGVAGGAVLTTLLSLGACARAHAQDVVQCNSLPEPIIYGVGGSAQTNLIGQIASRLAGAADPDARVTVVYAAPGACKAMDALNPDATDDVRLVKGTASYWDAGNPKAKSCQLPADGVEAAFGSMQQYADFCPGVDHLYDGLGDFKGPIGTVNLIVNKQSTQNSISAEAVHFIYGFGAAGEVEPWIDESFLIRRNETSAVQLYLAAAADLPPAFTKGIDALTNPDTIRLVSTGDPESSIGFVSGEIAEGARDRVRTLAYQAFDQECAYWPDSTPTAFDKINVRRGQYFLWGDVHLYAKVDGDGAITDPNVANLVGYVTGAVAPPPELPILDVFIDNYNIPRCAMEVQRTKDLGPVSSYQPDEPCGCYFDARATGRTSCDECETSDDCPNTAPACRYGYCEVQ